MYDFISIGDIVTDTFIKLKDASVNCDIDREHCTISMAFGDKIPDKSAEVVRAVGNSSNAAVAASRLGLNAALVTHMGTDENGRGCLDVLKHEGVSLEFVEIHENKETNHHYVLWYESDRTILVNHEEYERHLPDVRRPKWLYLSSLGPDSLEYHQEIGKYIKENQDVKLAFQPGTFQINLGAETLKEIYTNSQIFFSNIDEAEKILGVKGRTLSIDSQGSTLLEQIHTLGPKVVVLTDGPKGAYAYDGKSKWFVPPYPDSKPPFERTGAGDAFASTTVAAMALGKSLTEALLWGAVNSMSVVQQVGAQKGLLTRQEIEKYLINASEFSLRPL